MPEEAATPPADGGTEAPAGGGTEKPTFKAPKDQDEFDAMVSDRLRRERAKYADYDDVKAKAGKFDELEAANRSDLDKLTERATTAEGRATSAESDALRWEVALDKGLTKTQAKRLVGSTREELEADAAELLKDLGQKNKVHREGTNPPPGPPSDEKQFVKELFNAGG